MTPSTTAPLKRSKGLASSTTLLLKSCANDPREGMVARLGGGSREGGPAAEARAIYLCCRPAGGHILQCVPIAVKKSNLKPSSQFHGTVFRHIHRSTRSITTYSVQDDSHTSNASAGPISKQNNGPPQLGGVRTQTHPTSPEWCDEYRRQQAFQ